MTSSARYRAAILVVLAALSSLVAVVAYVPSPTPLSPWNTGWQGTSVLREALGARIATSPSQLACGDFIVVIPTRNLTTGEAEALGKLAECGAIVLLADPHGYSSPLLEKLDIHVVFHGEQVFDQVSSYGERWLLLTRTPDGLELVVPNATRVELLTEPGLLLRTSSYAYADTDGNGFYDTYDPMGSYPILAGWKTGQGEVVLVPSQLFPVNRYIVLADNTAFMQRMAGNRTLVIYLGATGLALVDKAKYALYTITANRPRELLVAAALVLSTLASLAWSLGSIDPARARRDWVAKTVALVASGAPFAAQAAASQSSYYAVPLVLLALWLPLTPRLFYSQAAAMSLVAAGLNPVYSPGYTLVTLLLARLVVPSEGYFFLGGAGVSLLLLQGVNSIVVLVYPYSSIGILASSASILVASLVLHATILSKTRVEALPGPREARLGEPVRITLRLARGGPVRLVARINGNVYEKLLRQGDILVAETVPEHLGKNRLLVETITTDLWAMARKWIGVFVFEYTVLPAGYEALKRARKILATRPGKGRGELFSVSLALLVRTLGTGRRGGVAVVPEAELGLIAKAIGEGRGLGGLFLRRLVEEYVEAVLRPRRSRRGEYIGVRDYVAGDSPRDIHWKKSLSRQALVVKEHASQPPTRERRRGVGGTGEKGGSRGGEEPVLIANLAASNPRELDAIISTLVGIVAERASKNPETVLPVVLVEGDYVAVLEGTGAGLLQLLYNALSRTGISVAYNYRSVARTHGPEELEYMVGQTRVRVFNAIVSSQAPRARVLAEALYRAGLRPPRDYSLVYGRPESSWASFTVYFLSGLGYRYTPLPPGQPVEGG